MNKYARSIHRLAAASLVRSPRAGRIPRGLAQLRALHRRWYEEKNPPLRQAEFGFLQAG